MKKKSFEHRMWFIYGCLVFLFAAVVVRSGYLQFISSDKLSNLSMKQSRSVLRIQGQRGDIFDREGRPLAVEIETPSIHANTNLILNKKKTANELARILGISSSTLFEKFQSRKSFLWIKRQVSQEIAAQIDNLKIEGIYVSPDFSRSYPQGNLASHVLGYTGLDNQGLEGLEYALDATLKGEEQKIEALRDARGGAVVAKSATTSAQTRGMDVVLTLDMNLQHAAQEAVDMAVQETQASWGMAIVLDVESSDILGLVVSPSYDLNHAELTLRENRRNRTVTDVFEPGSTFKPLVMAAALDANVIDTDTSFFCENGTWRIFGKIIRDTSAHGVMRPDEIIAKSSNICMAKIGALLGKERMRNTIEQLGFSQKLGLPFPGEAPGLFYPERLSSGLSLANVSFGQGIAVTLLQLAAAYRVLATDGLYQTPRLILRYQDQEGNRVEPPLSPVKRVFKSGISQHVRVMLEEAVSERGTGSRARISGFRVAGKTGTAQKVDAKTGKYSANGYMALFAGFLPADNPRRVIVVAIDEPVGAHTGGAVAAPVFHKIAEAAMHDAGILPDPNQHLNTTIEPLPLFKQEALSVFMPISASGINLSEWEMLEGLSIRDALTRLSENQDKLDVLSVRGFGFVKNIQKQSNMVQLSCSE